MCEQVISRASMGHFGDISMLFSAVKGIIRRSTETVIVVEITYF